MEKEVKQRTRRQKPENNNSNNNGLHTFEHCVGVCVDKRVSEMHIYLAATRRW